MSTQYIELPIDTDPQDVLNDCYTFMTAAVPGWTPAVPNLDVWLLMSVAAVAAESRDVASIVPRSIFRWFGANLISLPPIDDTSATATTTWTMVDAAGYTVPAGTVVSIPAAGDQDVAFETLVDVLIPPGSTVAAGVLVSAVTPGAAGTALGSIGGTVRLQTPLAFVAGILQGTITSGGQDAETDDEYLNRLAARLTLLAPRPILPHDFAVFARNVPGVFRAVAIDLYDPIAATYGNPRMVTMVGIDESGNGVSTPVKVAMVADLASRREINFIVNSMNPTQSLINVTYQVKAKSGYDPATVVADVNAALTSYLNPAVWGTVQGDAHSWENQPVVRYLEVAEVINSVIGVDYITTTAGNYDLTIAINPAALARVDLALPGVVPLPKANTLTGVAV